VRGIEEGGVVAAGGPIDGEGRSVLRRKRVQLSTIIGVIFSWLLLINKHKS
jgi:hypothetical protein